MKKLKYLLVIMFSTFISVSFVDADTNVGYKGAGAFWNSTNYNYKFYTSSNIEGEIQNKGSINLGGTTYFYIDAYDNSSQSAGYPLKSFNINGIGDTFKSFNSSGAKYVTFNLLTTTYTINDVMVNYTACEPNLVSTRVDNTDTVWFGYYVTCRTDSPNTGPFIVHGDGIWLDAKWPSLYFGPVNYYSEISSSTQSEATEEITNALTDVKDGIDDVKDSVDDLNQNITDDNVGGVEDAFESFEGFVSENSTITQLITMPITLYTSILNGLQSTCRPFALGNLYGTNLTIPCINIGNYLGSGLWSMIDVIISGFAIFAISKKLIKIFNSFSSMKEGDVIDD